MSQESAPFSMNTDLEGAEEAPVPDFVQDRAGVAVGVSIFADRAWLRDELREDVLAAGLGIRECAALERIHAGPPRALGELVLVDCPSVDGAILAALARLDGRAARTGAQLVICTKVGALEDVFACCDQSDPQILVDAPRAERVIAIDHALSRAPGLRVRELSEEDRLHLLRLTEQVGRIAERLDRLEPGSGLSGDGGVFRFESPDLAYRGEEVLGDRLVRPARPSLPDPRLIRRIVRQRQLRARFFDAELFADPAWDILLDLTAARAEHARVSVTSLCIASGVPPTTALRWIGQMTQAGLLIRLEDETDKRRAFIALSDGAADGMARYFAELGKGAVQMA